MAAKHPLYALAPDGSIYARFASVSAAARHLHRTRVSIIRACTGRGLCCNMKLIYEDDYIQWADYSYKPHRHRGKRGQFLPGHRHYATRSSHALQRLRDSSRATALRLARDPAIPFGKGSPLKPVICLTTGEQFSSIRSAAETFHIHPARLSSALSHGHLCHGLRFQFTLSHTVP